MTDVAGAWLDFGQASALVGVSAPRFQQLIDGGAIAIRTAPSGRPGVMKSDLLAWHRTDQAERRAALVDLARGIDREIFG